MNPGGELTPLLEEREVLFIGRAGSLEIFREEDRDTELLRKNTCFVAHPGEASLKLVNQNEHGLSRMISLGFRQGENQVPEGLSAPLELRFRGTRTSLHSIASGSAGEGVPSLSLDAEVSLAQMGKGERLTLETLPVRRMLLVALEGLVSAGKFSLRRNDSLMVMGEPLVNLTALELTRILIVDLPEYRSPREEDSADDPEPERGVVSVWRIKEERE